MSGLGKHIYLLWLKTPLLFILLSFYTASGQRYFSRTYTESDGLANSMVFGVVQDTSGLIWFSTRAGVTSYDGIRFRNYSMTDGLPAAVYAYLLIDEKGILWTIAQRGDLIPYYYNGTQWKPFRRNPPKSQTVAITGFLVSYERDSAVFYVTTLEQGLFVCRNGTWKQYTLGRQNIESRINGITRLENRILVATGKGIFEFEDNALKEIVALNHQLPSRNILAIHECESSGRLDQNCFYLLGNDFLGYFEQDRYYQLTTGFRITPTDITNHCIIYPDGSGNVYFGNDFYLYYFSGATGQVEHLDRNSGLISEGVTAILIDREINTWITGKRGITKIPSRRFSTYSRLNGLSDNEVASGLEISPGHYVFGHHGSLTFLDGKIFSVLNMVNKTYWEHKTRIQDMDIDRHRNLWVAATDLGFCKISPSRRITWYQNSENVGERFNSVVVMPDGRIFCSSNLHVYELRNQKMEIINFTNYPGSGIRKLFAGPNQSLMLATIDSGIIESGKDYERHYNTAGNPQANSVFNYCITHDHVRYAGTAAGLYVIQEGKLKQAQLGNHTITRPVYAILEDDLHRLWIGTDNGLYRWDGKQLDQFSTVDGLSGQEINRDAFFQDHSKHLWFGTNNGVTLYKPEYDCNLKLIPPPLISLGPIATATDSIPAGTNATLAFDNNNISFHFRILSYINENKVFYRYQLEGFDPVWSDDIFYHDNRILFNNLPPGKYRLAVKARNALGIWSQPAFSGWITINQPFYFRWWFITVLVILFSGLVFFIARMVIVARYNARLEGIVAARTAELVESEKQLLQSNASKDNFFSIIAHDLKSPFNAILGMLELLNTSYEDYSDQERKKMLASVRSASVRTIALLENLLTWAQSQKGILPFEPVMFPIEEVIDENIKLIEPAAVSKNIRLVKAGEAHVTVCADRNMVRTVIRNLISNAVKFTYPGGSVSIGFSAVGPFTTRISVSDNGQGISAENLKRLFRIDDRMANKGTNNETGTGLGLILCQEFVEKNHGQISVDSKAGEGSVFTVTLPSSCG